MFNTAFLTLYKKEVFRFWRVIGQTVGAPIVNSSLYLLIFGVSLGKSIQLDSGVSYLAFLIPGLVMMSVLNNAFQNSSSSITTSKFHGDLQDLRVVPLSQLQIISAYCLGGLTRGLLVGCITFSVGQIFYYINGQSLLGISNLFWLLSFLVLGGLVFALLGIIVAFYAKTFDQLSAVGNFVLLPLMYLGGVFYSIDSLHPFWQVISKVNPLLYLINGVRYGLIGVSDVDPWFGLSITLISGFALYFVARLAIKKGSYTRW